MPTIKLTARRVASLQPEASERTEYFDESLPGFCLRVSPGGHKSFVVMYRHAGRLRRLTLGAHPPLTLADARDKAKQALRNAAAGKDPAATKREDRQAESFGELAEQYLERHAKPKKRSWREDDRIIRRSLLPRWKNVRAKNITRAEVRALLDGIAQTAPIMANRTLAVARKIFNWAISQDILETNPCLKISAPGREKQRDRVLTEDEIKAIWKALDKEHPVMAATFRLRLLTAQRGAEIHSMRWKDIEGDWWTIPAEVAKNGLSHRVPLSPQAMRIVEQVRRITKEQDEKAGRPESEWVFPNPKRRTDHIYECQKLKQRVREGSRVGDFRPHDLRRTAASYMTSMGIPRLVVSKVLNHVESGVTAVYDRHSYDQEKREALEKWSAKLSALLSGLRAVSSESPT